MDGSILFQTDSEGPRALIQAIDGHNPSPLVVDPVKGNFCLEDQILGLFRVLGFNNRVKNGKWD